MSLRALARPNHGSTRLAGGAFVVLMLAAGARPGYAGVPDLFGGGRLVAYAPRGWEPKAAKGPGVASLRADADELFRRGFRAITTPAATPALAPVCRVFKRRGFKTVLVGVSDPRDAKQLRAAVKQKRCADGYVVGDGGLTARRYARVDLERAVRRLRAATGRPVAVRERLAAYDGDRRLLSLGDWAHPIANPFLAGEKDAQTACGWTIKRFLDLSKRVAKGTPVVMAETAFATAGDPKGNANTQRAFFFCVETRAVRFEYYEAFDQPWRGGPAAHWGLFRADGTPKMLPAVLASPTLTVARAAARLHGRVGNVAPERFDVIAYHKTDKWEPLARGTLAKDGGWEAQVGDAAEVAAVLVPKNGTPPPDVFGRLPQVDGEHVFAVAAVP